MPSIAGMLSYIGPAVEGRCAVVVSSGAAQLTALLVCISTLRYILRIKYHVPSNNMPLRSLDHVDLKILSALHATSGIWNVELAATVGMSPSPCLRRVKAL